MLSRIPSFIAKREGPISRRADTAEAVRLMRNFEDSGQGWFWSTDEEGRLTYLTAGIAKLLKVDDATSNLRFAELFVQADGDGSAGRTLPFILARHSNFEKLTLHAADEGEGRCWSVSGSPQFDGSGQFTGYRGSGVDITEQRKSSRHASHLAKYDSLTGLLNRLRMSEILETSLSAAEHQGRACTVMLIDLDRFKQVNDTLGHPAGDALLKQVGQRLLRIVGDKEKVFRLGGDEFQVILQDCDDRGTIGHLATDIIAGLSQPYSVDGSRCIIGASIGVAVGPVDGRTREELIRNADLALYASKSGGRGRFRFFSSELLQAAEDKRQLEEDLRDALAKGQMRLAYQPIVDARTNRVTGVEALIRWQHPQRGAISPELFIPIAEEANLIAPLGEWILRKACEDAATWPGKIRVAVNVSPIQFMNDALPAVVLSALATSGLAADRLELEITEGVFLGEASETDTMFAKLKDIGVRLALDDFGTGYSSLGYLRTAPFDKIKIDQTFVRAATLPGSRNGAIIAAIVALADALDMETTAEGIEYMDQLNLIRALGVSHIQGYLYSPGIGSEDLTERLTSGEWVIGPSGPARQRSDRQAMYRKAGAIHDGRYHSVLIRNLSETGALIEGLTDLPQDTQLIVDFGDGQLAFARVRRAMGRQQGVKFEQPLVSDGNGGFCTSRRVSPYLVNTIGLPTAGKPDICGGGDESKALSLDEIAKKLGLSLAQKASTATAWMEALAAKAGLSGNAGAPANDHGDEGRSPFNRVGEREGRLSMSEAERLIDAARTSHNRQLKFIVFLLMLTGARQSELLKARWDHLDLEAGLWKVPTSEPGVMRDIELTPAAIDLLCKLPRWEDCPYVIANPKTRKPYNSFLKSWEAARTKAGLPYVEIDDLRYCNGSGLALSV